MSVRPRKGRRVAFRLADGAEPPGAPDSVAGLRFTIEARYGGSVLVDLVDLRPRPLAIAFAAALRRAAGLGGSVGAATTIKQHVAAYCRFFAHLSEHAPSVHGAADLRACHLDDYDAALGASGLSSLFRHTLLAKPINALRTIAVEHPGLLDASLRDRLSYTSCGPVGRSRPRDAYSPYVARQLRDAARADVERLFRRFGAPLDDVHDDVHRRALLRVEAAIVEHGCIQHSHPGWMPLYHMRRRRGLPVGSLTDDLHGRHHLLGSDLPPLLTLLSLETGLEIECIKALTIDCLRNPSAGTVEVAYLKRRARGAEHRTIRVRDGGVGTPGGLIRRLIEVTAAARRHVPSDLLWVYHRWGALHTGIAHPRHTLDSWTARHRIVDDDGAPLRLVLSRLRKTHKALWYLKTEGHMARFAVGHTAEVAARHYADLPSLRPLHEAAVADALTEAMEAAAPTILTPEEEAGWRLAPGRVDHLPPERVSALLAGDQDVWLAACAGFYASPYGDVGAPCPQPFWGCLDCANAVITARKLPAIVAFLSFVEGERAGLSAADWQLKFGRAHARITGEVLPAFSDAVVADARRIAGTQILYLPPEAKA